MPERRNCARCGQAAEMSCALFIDGPNRPQPLACGCRPDGKSTHLAGEWCANDSRPNTLFGTARLQLEHLRFTGVLKPDMPEVDRIAALWSIYAFLVWMTDAKEGGGPAQSFHGRGRKVPKCMLAPGTWILTIRLEAERIGVPDHAPPGNVTNALRELGTVSRNSELGLTQAPPAPPPTAHAHADVKHTLNRRFPNARITGGSRESLLHLCQSDRGVADRRGARRDQHSGG